MKRFAASCAALVALASAAVPAGAADAVADAVGDARPIGVQVLVVDHDRTVYERNFGVRDTTTGMPVDAHTHFEIGSVTKQFTAAAILQLVEQGKVKLHDPLEKYVPQYRAGRRVTVEQLLWQVSGIPDFTTLPAFDNVYVQRGGRLEFSKAITMADVVKLLGDRPLEFAPGSRWKYSNTNYAFLGAIVAAASGLTWQDYVRRRLFSEAGMRESRFVDEEQQLDDMATGYVSVPGKSEPLPTGAQRNVGGPGGIVTTAHDLARWDAALYGGRIVSRRSLALMTTPSAASIRARHGYGFGLELDSFDGARRIAHGGRTIGFVAMNAVYPALAQNVIVLANASFADMRSIADAAFDEHNPRRAVWGHMEDPAVTALVKRLWREMVSGHVEQSLLAARMRGFMAKPRASKSPFAQYGPVSAWIYRGRRKAAGATAYRYKLVFADGRAILLDVGVTPQDDIAFIGYFKR